MSGLEELLEAHAWVPVRVGECACGWKADLPSDPALTRQHRAHVATEVAAWLLADEQVERAALASLGWIKPPTMRSEQMWQVWCEAREDATAALTAVLGGGGDA